MPKIVPDQQGLASALSLEVKILTTRAVPGDHTDLSKLVYIACAGRKNGLWKVVLIRSQYGLNINRIVDQIKTKWPLVTQFAWGTPSRDIARKLVESIGSDFDKSVRSPDHSEWDDRFCDAEDPSIRRRQLERMRAIPHRSKEREADQVEEQVADGDVEDLIEAA